ncbi:hypothetical protein C2S52_001646 [Perilla frutescens var. hirtella]|nr:hypothetical protein C2S51_006871 [Perilla frutescens var. frutescens]KAH6801182.1 hypothetical protein C2S52_001646 [Perilla frutescens var. hirtella]
MARGLDKKESSLMFREISPPYRWDQDSDSHYLRLTLPGFASSDVSLNMDKYGHLVVRGTRQMTDHKYLSFEETFDVPVDGDLEQAGGMFEDDQIYRVVIPKKKKYLGQRNINEDDHGHDSIFPKSGIGSPKTLPNKPSHPLPPPLISVDNSIKKIAFFIAILITIYVAWLNR